MRLYVIYTDWVTDESPTAVRIIVDNWELAMKELDTICNMNKFVPAFQGAWIDVHDTEEEYINLLL